MFARLSRTGLGVFGLMALAAAPAVAQARHNVIIFVADGLRRDSATPEIMPNLMKVRRTGVDFRNSHSAFPTFTTANASVIATGHAVGDTGDYSNTLYPGVWLAKPDSTDGAGYITPFVENDLVLADMNSAFHGNYLGERTLLSMAQEKGFNVAAVGKIGPVAIQQMEAVAWDPAGLMTADRAILIDDATGSAVGLPLPSDVRKAMEAAGLPPEAPLRSNGFAEKSSWNNGFSGDAKTPGTLSANYVQVQWFTDVTTKVLLPRFAEEKKPFVLLFWSRDPDGTQHNEGDSLQQLTPGINGETSISSLRNADRCLGQLLAWLDAHPTIKAVTDVLITSDHGFATISRREISADGAQTGQVSSSLEYDPSGKEAPEVRGTLPTGFLAMDLAVRGHLRVYDAAVRSTAGPSVFAELTVGGERSQHPSGGSALLGETTVQRIDGSDARLIVAANGGSDMIYVPGGSAQVVHETLNLLAQLDYVGGLFVDDKYCPSAKDCAGALPMSSINLVGSSKVPRPAILVAYKVFYQRPGDLLSAVQVSDTTLQEGQGMHGGFGRDQTFNNMAAMGPDFKAGFIDEAPMGNGDITPTLAKLLGIEMPSVGSLKGRVLEEALKGGALVKRSTEKQLISEPTEDGSHTVMDFQEIDGIKYLDRACFVAKGVSNCS